MGGTWPKCASATITLYRQQRRRQRRRRILRQLGITRLPSRRACQPPCTSIKPVRLILTIRKLLLFPYSLSPYLFRFVYVCNAENFREMRKDNEFSTLLSPRVLHVCFGRTSVAVYDFEIMSDVRTRTREFNIMRERENFFSVLPLYVQSNGTRGARACVYFANHA